MRLIKSAKITVSLALLAAAVWGCSSTRYVTEEVPPQVDLRVYRTIGVLDIAVSNQSVALQKDASRKFIASLQNAQPGIRLLELGTEQQVLAARGDSRLDAAAVKDICRQNKVDALITGWIDVSEIGPSLKFGKKMTSLSAKATVNASMTAKLYEMPSGASLWSDVASGKWTIAGFKWSESALGNVQISDPNEKYGRMVSELVNAVTRSLRPSYRKRRIQGNANKLKLFQTARWSGPDAPQAQHRVTIPAWI
jgi:hypothetical protein